MPYFKTGAFMMLASVLYACYPGGSIPIEDLDTVTTLYDSDDFVKVPTSAALSMNVVRIEGGDENDLPYDGEADDVILQTTLAQLIELYGADSVFQINSEADLPLLDNVSVVVVPNIILRQVIIGTVYPGWGWGGGWGWYPGWGGCYYCYYPPYVSYSKYEGGAVVLDMFNMDVLRKDIADNGGMLPAEFDPSWVAKFSGLISSSQQFNHDRIESGIQRGFDQSPYLSN